MSLKAEADRDASERANIFVSYSRKDVAFVDRLESALKARGFAPKIDRSDIYAFEDWRQRIEALIVKADTIVFVLSPDAVASDVCRWEVDLAIELRKRVAPIVCRAVEAEKIPPELARLNFVFFDDDAKFDARADKLAEALATDIDWIRKHTEFGELAGRWSQAGRPGPKGLLLRPPMLEEAERWIASRPAEAPMPTKATQDFIAESRKAETQKRNTLIASLGGGLAVALSLAGLAAWQWREASAQRERAETTLSLARQTADGLVFDLSQKFQHMAGMPAELRADILGRAKTLQQQLSIRDGDNADLKRSKAASLMETVDSFLVTGNTAEALKAGRESAEIMESLVKSDPGNVAWGRDLSLSHNKIGDVFVVQNDLVQALDQYRIGLQIIEKYANQNPGLKGLQRDRMVSFSNVGNVLVQQGKFAEALDYYKKDMETLKKLLSAEPENAELRRDFSISSNKIGDSLYYLGDYAAALSSYREGLQNISALSASQPKNSQWRRDVTVGHERIGDALVALHDLPGAMKAFRDAASIREALSAEDPSNIAWQRDLSVIHEKVGDVAAAQQDLSKAVEAFRRSLQIRERLSTLDRNNAEWCRDLMIAYIKLAQTEPANAREYLVKAKGIADELVAAGKLAPNDAGIPKIIDDALKALDAPAKTTAPPAPKRKR